MRRQTPAILVVEPELSMRRFISMSLAASKYEVVIATDAVEALKVFEELFPDLVTTEIDLAGFSGFTLCGRIREISDAPIIVVSSRAKELDKVTALDLGADDYVTKPFGIGEFLARVRAVMRRRTPGVDLGNGKHDFDELSIDFSARRVMRQGEVVKLTPTEFALLSMFVRNAGKVLTHRYLLETVWGSAYTGEREYLRAYVYQLRGKIERNARMPTHILNVPGVGYLFTSATRVPENHEDHQRSGVLVGASSSN